MDDQLATVGEVLSQAIHSAALALSRDDVAGAWQALDNPTVARAQRDWDRLRGRALPSEEQLQGEQAALVAELRKAVKHSPVSTGARKKAALPASRRA